MKKKTVLKSVFEERVYKARSNMDWLEKSIEGIPPDDPKYQQILNKWCTHYEDLKYCWCMGVVPLNSVHFTKIDDLREMLQFKLIADGSPVCVAKEIAKDSYRKELLEQLIERFGCI